MSLANSGVGVVEDLLARVRRVSPTSSVHVTADVTVSVADIVFVPRIKLVIREAFERLSPENDTLFKRKANSFQEERILKSTEVLQVVVLAQRHV